MKPIKSTLPKIPKAIFVLRDDVSNNQGESPIYITYNIDRKTAKTTTGLFIHPIHWDYKRTKVKQSHPRHQQLNSYLQLKRHELDTRILDVVADTELKISILRSLLKGEPIKSDIDANKDFVDFATDVVEREYKRDKIGISVLENNKCALHIFRRFIISELKKDVLLVREINETIIDDYIIWRKENRENSNETINKSLTPIFKAIKYAHSLNLVSIQTKDTICNRYLPPTKPKLDDVSSIEEVRYLTTAQLQQFLHIYNLVKYDRTRDYMDMFLFSFHACGLRFVDVLTLQWSNIDENKNRIRKILVKNKTNLTIPLTIGAKEILARWKGRVGCSRFCFGLLPSDFNLNDDEALNRQRLNRNRPIKTSLNEIGKKMNLPFTLSFHCARHTFAVLTLNRENNPLPPHIISRLLGHTSVLVTEKVYAKYIPQKLTDDLGLDNFNNIIPT